MAQGKGLDSSRHGSKREGAPELLVHREWEGPEAHRPASHRPGRLLRSIRRAVGEELGGLVWGGGAQALCLLVHFEEHLLLSFLLVQLLFQSLGQRADGARLDPLGHKSSPTTGPPPKWPSLELPLPGLGARVTWSSLAPVPAPITQKVGTTSSFLVPQPRRSFLWTKGSALGKCQSRWGVQISWQENHPKNGEKPEVANEARGLTAGETEMSELHGVPNQGTVLQNQGTSFQNIRAVMPPP